MRSKSLLMGIVFAGRSQLYSVKGSSEGSFDSSDEAVAFQRSPMVTQPCTAHLPTFDESATEETVVSFYAMGDTPYTLDQRHCLNQQLRNINITSGGPTFMIHLGDIKHGTQWDPCNNAAYNDISKMFTHPENALYYDPRDTFFVPGDNEWSDCYDLDDAWSLWTEHFGVGNQFGFGTFSPGKNIAVERQTTEFRLPGVDRSENFAFFINGVLFIGLNMVGGDDVGDEELRLGQNFNWTKSKLRYYKRRGMKACVLFAHARMGKPGPRKTYFGDKLMSLLRRRYASLPVMHVHGDGHDYCLSTFDENNENLYDLEVDDGGFSPPVVVSVVTNADPNDDTHLFKIDQRGGPYVDEDCPKIVERTWDAPPPPPNPTDVEYKVILPEPHVEPLGLCEGDCDVDQDCKEGLICSEEEVELPGCYGTFIPGKEYCYNPTPQIPQLVRVDKDSSTFSYPLDECQGDCGGDKHCAGQLTCFKRKSSEPVPGCSGSGDLGKDYCYDPPPDALVLKGRNGNPQSAFPLGMCQGTCKWDGQCAEGLKCLKRKAFEDVPGCDGGDRGKRGKNYCYDPNIK